MSTPTKNVFPDFKEIWSVDFEFGTRAFDGRPDVRCMCATELRSGHTIQLWEDKLTQLKRAPFDTSDRSLIVAYAAHAEMSCFLTLDWPVPHAVIDPYFEFRAIANGRLPTEYGRGLISALRYYRLPHIDGGKKEFWRNLAIRGGPYTLEEKAGLITYCQEDVDALAQLLPRMWPDLQKFRLRQMLFRGRYAIALARMDQVGIPLDVPLLQALRGNALKMLEGVTRRTIERGCDVFDGMVLSQKKILTWAEKEKIRWPLTPTGKPVTKENRLDGLTKVYPNVAVLKECVESRKLFRQLAVPPEKPKKSGSQQPRKTKEPKRIQAYGDGRSRPYLNPFGSLTGRNQPGGDFVFGKIKWVRGLMRPEPGWGIAYLDWVAQEVIVLAAVSGDPVMLADYAAGDPYLALAVAGGLAPEGATKQSHGKIRDACKIAFLAICYGVQCYSLSRETGLTPGRAQMLIDGHEARYRAFHAWRSRYLTKYTHPCIATNRLGWPWWTENARSERTIMDFPAQGNGSAMMQIACILATEAGIGLAATVHDGLLIVSRADRFPVKKEPAKSMWETVNQELRNLGAHPADIQYEQAA